MPLSVSYAKHMRISQDWHIYIIDVPILSDVVEAPQVHPFVYTEWVDLRDFPHAKLPTQRLAGPAWWAVGDSEMRSKGLIGGQRSAANQSGS